MGKWLTCLPRLTLAQLRLTLRSFTGCTCRWNLNFPHRPNGKLTFCSLLAGRWCLCRGWHSDHLIVNHQWEHSFWLCAPSSSKVPNAPMGKCLVDMCISALIFMMGAASNYSIQYMLSAPETSKVPIAPIGKWLTCPNRLSSFNWDRSLVLPGRSTCQPRLQTSHRPDGIFTSFALCLQGGGVFVQSGTVTISSCTISGNTARSSVRVHAQEFPLPQ